MDDVSTWPGGVCAAVESLADTVQGNPTHYDELDLDPGAVKAVGELLADHSIRAYHCTRLLEHEAHDIRRDGLSPLSRELIKRRIRAACDHDAIAPTERDRLLSGHMFATEEHHTRGRRLGNISFAATLEPFDTHFRAINPLLSNWGGEALYYSAGIAEDERVRLSQIGTPSIVVASLPIKQPEPMKTFFALPVYFTATWLGLSDVGCDLIYRAPVPGPDVLGIWQPGGPEYDRFAQLVRE